MKKELWINSTCLAYDVDGEGDRTFLLLHGNGEDRHLFDDLRKTLTREAKVIAPDTRGHGESLYTPPMTIRQFALDAEAILCKENALNVTVIGYSDGANVAMQMGVDCTQNVDKYVLISGNLYASALQKSFLTTCHAARLCLFPFSFIKKVKKLRALLGLMTHDIGIEMEQLTDVDVACEVLCAENDVIDLSHTKQIAKNLPNARLQVLPDCNHYDILKKITRLVEDGSLLII